MPDKKIYICESCAIKNGVPTDRQYMYHICDICGDGPCELYEAGLDQVKGGTAKKTDDPDEPKDAK